MGIPMKESGEKCEYGVLPVCGVASPKTAC